MKLITVETEETKALCEMYRIQSYINNNGLSNKKPLKALKKQTRTLYKTVVAIRQIKSQNQGNEKIPDTTFKFVVNKNLKEKTTQKIYTESIEDMIFEFKNKLRLH